MKETKTIWMFNLALLKPMPDHSNKTIGEIFNTLNEEQKMAVYALIGTIIEKEN